MPIASCYIWFRSKFRAIKEDPWRQAKVQEGDAQLGRLQAALQSQQARNDQLQNALQATEAQLQEAHAVTNAEHLRVTLLQEAGSAREAAVQLLQQQLGDAEQKVRQQGLELQVSLIFIARLQRAHLLLGRLLCMTWVSLLGGVTKCPWSCHLRFRTGQVMSCHVMSCHVMSCHVMSCHVTSKRKAAGRLAEDLV